MTWTILIFIIGLGVLYYALNKLGLVGISLATIQGAKAVNKTLSNQYYLKNDKVMFHANGNFVNQAGHVIKDADPASFVVLSYQYAKDDSQVFYQDNVIKNADPKTFKVFPGEDIIGGRYLSCKFARDNFNAYLYNKIIVGAQPKTFSPLWGEYCRDETNIFYKGQKFTESTAPAEKVANDINKDYIRLGDVFFYRDKPIPGVDAESFILIGEGFARDSKQVYYYEHPISGVNAGSFKRLNRHYSLDNQHVYFHGEGVFKALPGSDPKNFNVINQEFGKDKEQVYYNDHILREVDANTFDRRRADSLLHDDELLLINYDDDHCAFVRRDKMVELSSQYYIYNNEIYSGNTRLADATVDGFSVFEQSGMYAKDSQNVFYRSHTIMGADRESFQVINSGFAKDNNHVYFQHLRLADVDPNSFNYVDGMRGEPIDDQQARLVSETTPAT